MICNNNNNNNNNLSTHFQNDSYEKYCQCKKTPMTVG